MDEYTLFPPGEIEGRQEILKTEKIDTKEKKSEITRLEKQILRYQNSYYNGEGEISDEEFDALWDRLKILDPDNSLLKKVGADNSDGFPKAEHILPMGSQEKAADPEEFYRWAEKHKYREYLVQYKLDGASIELQYLQGEFKKAVTRGDGKTGDDITPNARKMKGVVFSLPKDFSDFTGGIRGEVLMFHQVHKDLYSDKANCRNAANGLMKRKDGIGAENLNIICYDAMALENEKYFPDEKSKIEWLKSAGFNTVEMKICPDARAVVEYRGHVMDIRNSIPFDIDGLVVKENRIDPEDMKRARPDRQIAFKFSLEEAVTVLRNVEWSESGATYTPVAIVDPVKLAGTTVQRASLANWNTIKALNLKIGSRVVITKRGEIIPKIESLVENPPDSLEITVPDKCDTCGSSLVNEGTRLFCPNKNCGKRVLHQLEKWVSVLEIKELGPAILNRLFSQGLVKSILDLYLLKESDLCEIERMGELSAGKIIKNIHGKKEIPLSSFIGGLDIEGIGEVLVEKLEEAGFDTVEKLLSASKQEIAAVYQFGEITASVLTEGLNENRDVILGLINRGFIKIQGKTKTGNLSGKSFCFTGELDTMKRSEAENIVKANGGSVKSSVSKGLSFLVTNTPESGSSKNKKAAELNITIITESEFLALVNGTGSNNK